MNEQCFKIYAKSELDSYCCNSLKDPQRYIFKDLANELETSINDEDDNNLTVLYGLYYTGKSTMLGQAAGLIGGNNAAIIKIESEDVSFEKIYKEITKIDNSVNYIFIDEITLMKDMPYLINLIKKDKNHRYVLSGTDSLAFYLARDDEILENRSFIHTTFIPFLEYKFIIEKI